MKFVAIVLSVLVSTVLLDKKSEQDSLCYDCEFVVDSIHSVLLNPYFDVGAEEFLELTVCSKVPVYAAACAGFVRNFVPQLLHYLSKEIQPLKICDEVNLCDIEDYPEQVGASFRQKQISSVPVSKIEDEIFQNNNNNNNNNNNYNNLLVSDTDKQVGELSIQDLACSFCLYHTEGLFAGQNCEQSCMDFPLNEQCVNFCEIDLVPTIKKFGSAVEVCTQLSVCVSNSIVKSRSHETIKSVKNFSQEEYLSKIVINQKSENETCLLCKAFVTEIRVYIHDQEDRVREALNVLCDTLVFDNGTCKMIVDQYLSKIFDIVDGYLDPVVVCTDLDQCPKQNNTRA